MTYYFSGTIERVIFENANNFFKIILLEIDDTDSDFDDFEIIVTGTIADVIEGETYTFWGELTKHPKYGEQLKVERYERAKPSSAGLIKYFSSDHFNGIGKKTAEKIIQLYGDEPIDKILKDPSKLSTIPGLSKVNREKFISKLRLNYGTEQILAKLAEYGINTKLAVQIFDHYREDSLDIIKDNPYQLVEDIQGIGFKLADQLAEQLGIQSDAPQRFRAALVHTLLETSINKGDTYIEAKELLEKAIFILEEARQAELDPSQVAQELSQLIIEDKVQNIDTKIFDNTLFYAEIGIQKHLSRILNQPLKKPIENKAVAAEISHVQEDFNIHYDIIQKGAIQKALQNKVFLLTGGPGTGKTTVINGIIKAYANLHKLDLSSSDIPIILAAPTGRAARRMNELTGLPSATIHRHLGLNSDSDYQALEDFLDCDLIIIDEFSMVDTWLANQLFSAIASDTQVIIVGDSDQLPSVGPGQVLADLLKVNALPQVSLSKIFRQSEDSTIVTLAGQIRQGILPADFTEKKADRSYFQAQSSHIPPMITKIVKAALKSGIAAQDVQILAPMYRGQAGINNLNTLMQELLNPLAGRLEFQFNELHFRKGDKVLQLVNDAEINVFNGDIGYITDLLPAKYTESKQDEIIIDFEGTEISYPRNDWSKITLAYAMSIHKSQGSEFKVVILPITRQGGRLLQRNLVYTAITRSKSKLIMLGEIAAFEYAVKNQGTMRRTYLVERFEDSGPKTNQIPSSSPKTEQIEESPQESKKDSFILTENNLLTIDPMIGLSQADFDTFFKD
ncbi:putative exodeoxyribonuclease V [Streptococcus ratti FA-1 = DSM 20564]|uniref:ATP-dependent RecD2 DNA helicase n=1 Tax=Streptococcus ratti FA-1 = DSM 20564 TaxID=699248 RepID=A0ABP2R0S2_STRRT|nr:ATP-dependent RecD-like DNA helicase [Streptococcus ratti]EJN94939.1 putative exodeoxyribonuclease V, conjugation transfer protein [Streptococcus ratti FA-1 = DSM 20564]EMP69261.1 putative exodeoxyribonuclease V [Streptococcus ratti FA-1 = DSM 20564]VEI59391.1 exodeoxyribonuclease V [Streptococcus mutans]